MGHDLNGADSMGLSALHHAVRSQWDEAIWLLLQENADVDAVDEEGWTPLHYAAREGCHVAVALLLRAGADASIVAEDSFSALQYARLYKHAKCVHLLEYHLGGAGGGSTLAAKPPSTEAETEWQVGLQAVAELDARLAPHTTIGGADDEKVGDLKVVVPTPVRGPHRSSRVRVTPAGSPGGADKDEAAPFEFTFASDEVLTLPAELLLAPAGEADPTGGRLRLRWRERYPVVCSLSRRPALQSEENDAVLPCSAPIHTALAWATHHALLPVLSGLCSVSFSADNTHSTTTAPTPTTEDTTTADDDCDAPVDPAAWPASSPLPAATAESFSLDDVLARTSRLITAMMKSKAAGHTDVGLGQDEVEEFVGRLGQQWRSIDTEERGQVSRREVLAFVCTAHGLDGLAAALADFVGSETTWAGSGYEEKLPPEVVEDAEALMVAAVTADEARPMYLTFGQFASVFLSALQIDVNAILRAAVPSRHTQAQSQAPSPEKTDDGNVAVSSDKAEVKDTNQGNEAPTLALDCRQATADLLPQGLADTISRGAVCYIPCHHW